MVPLTLCPEINDKNTYFLALKYAETYRLDVAEQLAELLKFVDYESHLEKLRINIINSMGLVEGSKTHSTFCKSVSYLQTTPNNKVYKILTDI